MHLYQLPVFDSCNMGLSSLLPWLPNEPREGIHRQGLAREKFPQIVCRDTRVLILDSMMLLGTMGPHFWP